MMQAVIIDDDYSNIENLTILLHKYCPAIIVAGTATGIDQALRVIDEVDPAIVFLDIQMPGGSGFDLLKTLTQTDFEIIFVTAFDQYALRAIKFSAIDYLLKPIHIDELILAVKKAVKNADTKKQNLKLENLVHLLKNKNDQKIAIPSVRETLFIAPADINYCQADNNYTLFYLVTGEKPVSSKPIFEYEEMLMPYGFLRCHQSYLINMAHIKSWIKTDGDRLLMLNGIEIPISRNKKQLIKNALY